MLCPYLRTGVCPPLGEWFHRPSHRMLFKCANSISTRILSAVQLCILGNFRSRKMPAIGLKRLLGVPIAQTAGLGLPPRLRAGPPDLRLQPSTFLAGVLGRQSTYG